MASGSASVSGGTDDPSSMSEDQRPWRKLEVPKHRVCGEDCPLRRVIEKVDAVVTVDTDTDDSRKIISGGTAVAERVAQALQDLDPMWSCSVEWRGSTKNGLKVGRLDEIDYLFRLHNIALSENDGFKKTCTKSETKYLSLASERIDTSITGPAEARDRSHHFGTTGPASHPPLRAEARDLSRFLIYERKSTGSSRCVVSAAEIKEQFIEALETVLKTICQPANATTSTSAVLPVHVMFDGETLYYLPPEVPYAVKLDITPCVSYTDCSGDRKWLVPRRSVHWVPVNDDPAEIKESSSVCQAVRVLKAFCASTERLKMRRDIGFVVEGNSDSFTERTVLSEFLTKDRKITEAPYIPSYAILGTVVQCYNSLTRHEKQSLCLLVVVSCIYLERVSPDGKYLHHIVSLHTLDARIVLNVLLATKESSDLDETIQMLLPYKRNAPASLIGDLVRDDERPVLSVSCQLNDVRTDVPTGVEMNVYHLRREEFTASLVKPLSLAEKVYAGLSNATVLKVRRELDEVRSGGDDRKLYLVDLRCTDLSWWDIGTFAGDETFMWSTLRGLLGELEGNDAQAVMKHRLSHSDLSSRLFLTSQLQV